jgi:hypothetical protein
MKLKNAVGSTLVEMAAGAGLFSAYIYFVRPWHLRWGATDEEVHEVLPGDELVPNPESGATHAITIAAPVAEVWGWLVQIGQTRGGFYSYTWLENLVGCDMRNAEAIVPEWQTLRAGDVVWLHPKAPPLAVLLVIPQRAMVLGEAADKAGPKGVGTGTWGLYVKEIDEKTTRLIVRNRWVRRPGLVTWLGNYGLLEPAHFVMERKMMLGIKARAEGRAPRREKSPGARQTASV